MHLIVSEKLIKSSIGVSLDQLEINPDPLQVFDAVVPIVIL